MANTSICNYYVIRFVYLEKRLLVDNIYKVVPKSKYKNISS